MRIKFQQWENIQQQIPFQARVTLQRSSQNSTPSPQKHKLKGKKKAK